MMQLSVKKIESESEYLTKQFIIDVTKGKPLYPGSYHIASEEDAIILINKIITEIKHKISFAQRDYGIQLLLLSISRIYYGDENYNKHFGNAFKRALACLWNSECTSYNRGILQSILDILKLCYVTENLYGYRMFFLISENFCFDMNNGYVAYLEQYQDMIHSFNVLNTGAGRRMRISKVNSILISNHKFYPALEDVMAGKIH